MATNPKSDTPLDPPEAIGDSKTTGPTSHSGANDSRRPTRTRSLVLLALSLLALVWVTGSIGQLGPPPFGLVGLWPGYLRGNATIVTTSGNHAYVGMTVSGPGGCSRGWRGRLEVIDISDPNHPVWLSALDFREPLVRLQASNGVLYAASGRTLSVFTVTNAAAPGLIGQYETDGDIQWFQLRDPYVFAVGYGHLDVFDVSNPGQPLRVGSAGSGWCLDGQVAGDYAYVAGYNGLQVFDVSVPTQPVLLTTNQNSTADAQAVDIAGGYAYLTTAAGLKILSITNPAQPVVVGTNAMGAGNRILTAGPYCYAVVGNRLEVLDVTDPAHPGSVGGYDVGAPASDLVLAGHYAFVAAGAEGLQILDLTHPASPAFVAIGTRETGGPAEAIQVVGNYAYLADGDSGLTVIDVAGTNGLVRVGHLRTTNYARAINLVGNSAYVGTRAGLKIIDVSDPAMPHQVGSFDSGQVMDIQVAGNLAYLTTGGTLQIVDVSIPAQPRQITNCAAVNSSQAVKVVGQLAYVTGWINSASNSFNGLAIIDVLDPATPKLVGSCPTIEGAEDVDVVGNLAYVNITRSPGESENERPASWLQIIDVTNPAQPTPLGWCPISEDAHGIQVVGRYAYISGGSWRADAPVWRDGLMVVDVSDPANPTRVCGFSTPGWAAGIQVVGDHVYLADGPAGLAVLSLPAVPTGPLTAEVRVSWTNIVVGYELSLTGWIDGWAAASVWDFGDGTTLSNRLDVSHAWAAPGDYTVALRAYNESNPQGVSATVAVHVVEGVYYVAAGTPNPLPPYTSWGTAATNIQDAIDVLGEASLPPGSVLVLVSNGVYATGGRAVGTNLLVNRVAVDKPITVRSVNGPRFTVIRGYQVPGTTNGNGAIRCVYLTIGASLSGFTLTNGATRVDFPDANGGGVYGSPGAVVSDCLLAGNSAGYGGGAYGDYLSGATLDHCVLAGNSAYEGGGAWGGTLNYCLLSNNVVYPDPRQRDVCFGGGAAWSQLNDCVLVGNSHKGTSWGAGGGGGAALSYLNRCTLIGNSAYLGGGARDYALNNCTLIGNHAEFGGGAHGTILNNCTVLGNSATQQGGGIDHSVSSGAVNNCIVYFNAAPEGANCYSGNLTNCCTVPLPARGVGNITNAPLFLDYAGGDLRLHSNSPCINAGNNTYAPGPTDLDGNPRLVSGTVDIGAYEFQGPGSVISYAWLQHFGLPTDSSADGTDLDADGHNNWEEWRCQTDPTNALSVLRLLSATSDGTNVTVSWQSIAGVPYLLGRSTNLSASPPFLPLASGLEGRPGTTSFTDTNAAFLAPLFYRVGVGP